MSILTPAEHKAGINAMLQTLNRLRGGKTYPQVGHMRMDRNELGYCLYIIVNEDGGVTNSSGRKSLGGFHKWLGAYLAGYIQARSDLGVITN